MEQAANDLVRQVVEHELSTQDLAHWRYQQRTEKSGLIEVAEVFETKDGDLRRVLTRNGQPLTPDQMKSEDQGMEKFVASTDQQQKQRQAIGEDRRKIIDLFTLLPDALSFEYAGRNGGTVTLNFRSNPEFHPPSREAHVFHEMEGQLIIDSQQKRVVEFSGHLLHEIRFGIIGHLDQGGTFDVLQQEVAPGHWEVTLLKINIRGKALFFKNIDVQHNEVRNRFQQVPETTTLTQAAELLRRSDVI